jgi:hypothetical protein
MPNLISILEQDEVWYGQDGFPYYIAEMGTSHIVNVLAFLRRRADNIYERKQWLEMRHMENAPEEVWNDWVRQNQNSIPSDPLEWLNNRPLMQRFEQELKLRTAIEPDTLQIEGANPGVMVRRDVAQ